MLLLALALGLGLALVASGGWRGARGPIHGASTDAPLETLACYEAARPLAWRPAGRPALLLAFSTSCGRCDDAAESWRALLEPFVAPDGTPDERTPFELMLLTRDDDAPARGFLARHGLAGGRLLHAAALTPAWEERLARVPLALLLDPDARLLRSATGTLDARERARWQDALAAAGAEASEPPPAHPASAPVRDGDGSGR